jgi:hypothetical protein
MKSLTIFVSLLSVALAVPPAIFDLAFFPLGSYRKTSNSFELNVHSHPIHRSQEVLPIAEAQD